MVKYLPADAETARVALAHSPQKYVGDIDQK